MNAARLARRWVEAGDDRLVMAEALADELTEGLATKADLGATRVDLRAEIQAVKGELQNEIQAVKGELQNQIQTVKGELQNEIRRLDAEIQRAKADTIKRFAGLLLIQGGLVVSLVRFL